MRQLATAIGRIVRSARVYAGIGTNALSSLGNFALSISLARTLDLTELGEFAVAFALYAFIVGLIRAAVSEPLLASLPDREKHHRGAERVSLLGLVAVVVLVIGGWALGLPYVVLVGLAIHGLSLLDYSATMNIAAFDKRIPLAQEIAKFTFSVTAGMLVLFGVIGGLPAFAIWAFGGTFVGYVSAYLQSYEIRPRWGIPASETGNSVAFGGDYVVGAGASQIAFNLVGAVAGLAAVGSLRAGGTLLGPVSLVVSSARSLTIPYLSRAIGRGRSASLQASVASAAVIGVATVPVLGVIAFLPDVAGELLLGENWFHAKPVLGFLALEMASIALTTIPFAGFRALLAGRATMVIRSLLAVFRVGIVVWAAATGGVVSAAIAMAFASGIGMLVWWSGFIILLRKNVEDQS